MDDSSPNAISELYDRYNRLVYSLAYFIVGDTSTAEEVTQDVFLRIWEKASTYREDEAKVNTWLTSITRYRAIDILRKRRIRVDTEAIGLEDIPLKLIPNDSSVEELTEKTDRRITIRKAILTLPEEQRRVLYLAYFSGLSHSEISNHIGEPLGTVKTRIRLGMQKLREILENDKSISS